MTTIIVPQLDANIVDVTVTVWRRGVGEAVIKGECLAEITTDKAVYEISAPESGVLLAIYAQEKSVVPVGYILGAVGAAGEVPPEEPQENAARMAAYQDPAAVAARVVSAKRAPRVRATPKARRIAAERGIELTAIQEATGAKLIDEATIQRYLEGK